MIRACVSNPEAGAGETGMDQASRSGERKRELEIKVKEEKYREAKAAGCSRRRGGRVASGEEGEERDDEDVRKSSTGNRVEESGAPPDQQVPRERPPVNLHQLARPIFPTLRLTLNSSLAEAPARKQEKET